MNKNKTKFDQSLLKMLLAMTLSFSSGFSYAIPTYAQDTDQPINEDTTQLPEQPLQVQDQWTIGQESDQAIHFELVNKTGYTISSIHIYPDGYQEQTENLIPEGNVFSIEETKQLFYTPSETESVDTTYTFVANLDGKGEYKEENLSLSDIQQQATLLLSEESLYLEYISSSSGKSVSTLETPEELPTEAQPEQNEEIIEEDIEETIVEEKEEEKQEDKKKDEDKDKVYPEIAVQIADNAQSLVALSQTDSSDYTFQVNPGDGSTSTGQTISDLEGIDETYEEIIDSNQYSGNASEKVEEVMEETGLYETQQNGDGTLEVTNIYAYKRLMLTGNYQSSIQAYGAIKAVYYNGIFYLMYDSEQVAGKAYEKLAKDFGDQSVFPDFPLEPQAAGWGYDYMEFDAGIEQAGDNEVIVAVLDTGLTPAHEIFNGRVVDGIDLLNNDNDPSDDYAAYGHGTPVSGIIAESTPSNVKIMPIKVGNSAGSIPVSTFVAGVIYAQENGAHLINASLGAPVESNVGYAAAIDQLEDQLRIPMICAAGNEGKSLDSINYFPAESTKTIAVSAIKTTGEKWTGSNSGSAVDFTAPGVGVKSYGKTGSISNAKSGTSFAAPYISAVAAILLTQNPSMSQSQLTEAMANMCVDLGTPGKDNDFGYGYPKFDSTIKNGFKVENGKTYYYVNDEKIKGQKKIGDYWYMFDLNTGEMKTGFYQHNSKSEEIEPINKKVYYDAEGHMVFGWRNIDGKTYYFEENSGAMAVGWKTIDKKIYYFSDKGVRQTGYIKVGNNWYWLNEKTGVREYTGVVKNPSDNNWYFVRNGIGEKFTGWSKSIENGKWYFTRNGILDWSFTGVAKSVENGKWYHGKNGRLDWNFTGFSKSVENGKWYFSRKGALDWSFTGVAKSIENGKWYFAKKGALDWSYNGGAKSVENGKWYAVQKGSLNWNYNGKMSCTDGKTRTFKKGAAV